MADALSTNATGPGRARGAALTLLALLAVASLLAACQGERSAVSLGLLVLLLVTPLAIAVPGMLARNRRTFAWATLCVTPHFIYALTELVANPSIRVLAASILVLSLALVVAKFRFIARALLLCWKVISGWSKLVSDCCLPEAAAKKWRNALRQKQKAAIFFV